MTISLLPDEAKGDLGGLLLISKAAAEPPHSKNDEDSGV
jgi:hypothetical protein